MSTLIDPGVRKVNALSLFTMKWQAREKGKVNGVNCIKILSNLLLWVSHAPHLDKPALI